MRKLILLVLVLTAAFATAFTQPAPKGSDPNVQTEQTILKLTRDWLDAEDRNDRATLRRIIADDFQGISPTGRTVSKDDVIPLEESRTSGLSINVQDLKARVFGEAAVVTVAGVQKAGEKRDLRVTVVFAKRGNSWQMVAGHLSAVPPRE